MEAYEQNLHISDEAFDNMRTDADHVLQRLLKNMIEKDSLEGKITISIDVSLTREYIPNTDPRIEGETRKIFTPKFSHKVGSVMQIKNEEKGSKNCDGMEMVWNEEKGEYVMRYIANTQQMSIFDADFKCVNDPDYETDPDGDDPALEGRRVFALPEPVEDDVEESSGEPDENGADGNTEEQDDIPFAPDDNEDDYGYEEANDIF